MSARGEDMAEKKQSTYNGYTPARKKANEKYNAKFHEVKVRMSPERHEMVKKYAQDKGESTSAFINQAIDEAIERDNQ
jgi:predicted HicB family RNase H-like nuclease